MKLASSVLLLTVAVAGFAQPNLSNDLIFTDTQAIGMLPPVVVSQGTVQSATWSGDGKYLLVMSLDAKLTPSLMSQMILTGGKGAPPPMDQVLSLFSVEKQSSTVIWKGKAENGGFNEANWLPGGKAAVVSFASITRDEQGNPVGGKQTLLLLSPSTGKMTQIYEASDNEYVDVATEPDVKGAVLILRKYPANPEEGKISSRYVWISTDGKLGNGINAADRKAYGQVVWPTPNKPMLVYGERGADGKAVQKWCDMDFATGQLRDAQAPKIEPPKEKSGEFELIQGGSQAQGKDKVVNLKAAWLVAKAKSQRQSALVAAEVDSMSLSPALNAVFYSTKGVPMVRPLMTMPKELAMKAIEAAERAVLMSDCKQVGTAFMIYAADYDDNLPSSSSDWMESLYPYTKNRSLMDGFIYTFGGGNMNDIKDPASTQLGYKEGAGGRAIVYADGHVKWVPNK
jgi:hypothetical protein